MDQTAVVAGADGITHLPQTDGNYGNKEAAPRGEMACLQNTDDNMQEDKMVEEGVRVLEKCSLEIDKEVFDRWCVIGITEALSSDTDIASFLIQQYEKVHSGGDRSPNCANCNTPLTLQCPRCVQPAVHAQDDPAIDRTDLRNHSCVKHAKKFKLPNYQFATAKRLPFLQSGNEDGVFQVKPDTDQTERDGGEECQPSFEFLDSCVCGNVAESKGENVDGMDNHISPSLGANQRTSDTASSRPRWKLGLKKKGRKRKTKLAEQQPPDENRHHKCELCPAAFFRRSNLVAHLVRHGVEKPHKCKQCSESFRKYAELQAHDREAHLGKNYDCKLCGTSFKHGYKLTEHMRRHSGEKPYICDICGAGYITAADRNIHRRIHTGEKPYMCSTCGKTFARSGCLAVHKRTHQVDKPHVCTECGRAFKHQSHLKDHMRTHSGLRPFQCELCGKAMAHRSTLKYHMRTHTGQKPYTCPVCGKAFGTCSNMWQHRRTHKT